MSAEKSQGRDRSLSDIAFISGRGFSHSGDVGFPRSVVRKAGHMLLIKRLPSSKIAGVSGARGRAPSRAVTKFQNRTVVS